MADLSVNGRGRHMRSMRFPAQWQEPWGRRLLSALAMILPRPRRCAAFLGARPELYWPGLVRIKRWWPARATWCRTPVEQRSWLSGIRSTMAVSYTHLRAHETP